ncbi:hypothetical protein LTR27_005597 [Elasticomyces elasticus]|nr:hypothetical protein LTR27_005597 [Elasticomyces elasticus]
MIERPSGFRVSPEILSGEHATVRGKTFSAAARKVPGDSIAFVDCLQPRFSIGSTPLTTIYTAKSTTRKDPFFLRLHFTGKIGNAEKRFEYFIWMSKTENPRTSGFSGVG